MNKTVKFGIIGAGNMGLAHFGNIHSGKVQTLSFQQPRT